MGIKEERTKRTEWFLDARFGMFIHWGLYAIPAKNEWVRSLEKISNEEYQRYFDEFDPVKYNPKEWAKTAKAAGMKYVVMTAKHHDGFCMFDSKLTDYKSTNTKAKRDLIKEYVEAFRAEGLKVGIYYSLIDWHHKDYPQYGDRYHPMRENEEYKDKEQNFSNYVQYLHGQVRELLTNYGKIDLMWFDFSYDNMIAEKWEATKLVTMMRSLQPGIVIDNRLGGNIKSNEPEIYSGDFASPEQILPTQGIMDENDNSLPWEACITLNKHWGYCAEDKDYKSAETIIRTLVECVSKNGNLLLNIGPNAKGEIPKESIAILSEVGEWMGDNSESIYGCGIAELPRPEWGRYTQRGNKIYGHIYERGIGRINLRGLASKISRARLVSDSSQIKIDIPLNDYEFNEDAFINFSKAELPDERDTVVELEIEKE